MLHKCNDVEQENPLTKYQLNREILDYLFKLDFS